VLCRFARSTGKGGPEKTLQCIPLAERRRERETVAATSFSGEERADSRRKVRTFIEKTERTLVGSPWLAGDTSSRRRQ